MKKIFLETISFNVVLIYLVGAFIAVDFNILNWSPEGRAFLALIWAILSIGMFVIRLQNHEYE